MSTVEQEEEENIETFLDEMDPAEFDSDEDDDDDDEEDEESWITWFLGLKGNEFLCIVDQEFLQDEFNLHGLSSVVPFYDHAYDLIQDADLPFDTLTDEQQDIIETAAEVLYGLIHARFILTPRGMDKMKEKYLAGEFGTCPRIYCHNQPLLPASLSDSPGTQQVSMYCPRCRDLYSPRSSRHGSLDGAYFGSTFSHLFLLLHSNLIPTSACSVSWRERQRERRDNNNNNNDDDQKESAGEGEEGEGGEGKNEEEAKEENRKDKENPLKEKGKHSIRKGRTTGDREGRGRGDGEGREGEGRGEEDVQGYTPRIFGFRIHPSSLYYPK